MGEWIHFLLNRVSDLASGKKDRNIGQLRISESVECVFLWKTEHQPKINFGIELAEQHVI